MITTSLTREQINAEWDGKAREYLGRLKDAGRLAVVLADVEIVRLADAVGYQQHAKEVA